MPPVVNTALLQQAFEKMDVVRAPLLYLFAPTGPASRLSSPDEPSSVFLSLCLSVSLGAPPPPTPTPRARTRLRGRRPVPLTCSRRGTNQDSSGALDKNEIKQLMQIMEPRRGITNEELDAAMVEIDTSGDGQVDFTEFKIYCKHHTQSPPRPLLSRDVSDRLLAGTRRAQGRRTSRAAVSWTA